MTVKELIKKLEDLPPEATATYFHNTYGVVHIQEIEERHGNTVYGEPMDIIVLRGVNKK